MREQILLGITLFVMALGWGLDEYLTAKGKERTMLFPSMLFLWLVLLVVATFIPVK